MHIQRLNAVIAKDSGMRICAEHQRDIRTVHVSVEQTGFVAELRQSQRKVHGESGFAHASLTRTNGHDGVNSWNRLGCRRLSGTRRHLRAQEITWKEESQTRLY